MSIRRKSIPALLGAAAAALAIGAGTARAANVVVHLGRCLGNGGQATVPAGSTISVFTGFFEVNRGVLQNFFNAQTTTLSVNNGAPVNVNSLYGPPHQNPDGSWQVDLIYPTGITLANPGDSMTFTENLTLSRQVAEVLNGPVGFADFGFFPGAPLFSGPGPYPGTPATCTVTAASPPQIYWTDASTGAIGRANANGGNPNPTFITGASLPWGVAVDSSHVYWANFSTGTIGRADLNGQNVDQNFITGASFPHDVAVDSSHVYWANFSTGTIGRADLDGQNVDQNFITGAFFPRAVAVDAGHVYWTNDFGTIGRADLDGQNVNQNFISAGLPNGLAVDSAHLYWSNGLNTIGRADLDGQNVNTAFISGAAEPAPVAVDSTSLYWGNLNTGTIGRADLNGQNVNQSLVSGISNLTGLAAGSG